MEAHLIPEMLGNKLLYSEFECDHCNEYFKALENDLANYLGIVRTLTGIKGKENVPTFKSAGNKIRVDHREISGDATTTISRDDADNGSIHMDMEKGMISVSFQDNPYTPKSVYRALLKIALSLLDESVVTTAYQPAIDLLMDRQDMDGCVLRGFQFPYSTAFPPYALFFQKKDRFASFHTHVMMLYVQNFIFHVPMPLHVNDLQLYDGSKAMSLLVAVPFVNENTSPEIAIEPFFEDLSSNQRKYKRNSGLSFHFDPADAIFKDVNDNITEDVGNSVFNPDEVMKIIMKSSAPPLP